MRQLQRQRRTNGVQDFIDYSLAWLQDRNYTLAIDAEMAGWARMMRTIVGDGLVNPSFDPQHSRLSPHDSFWLDIRAGSETIAISAARLLVTDNFIDLMRSMKLWYREPRETFDVALASPIPAIGGRVGYEGGLWVHPRHRRRGLSAILPHLNRALCLTQWNVNWQTGLVHRSIAEHGLARRAYGFSNLVQCSNGFFPVTQKVDPLYLVYLSETELLAGIDPDTVAGLLPDRNRQTINPGAYAQER
jgi:hypothetical protein